MDDLLDLLESDDKPFAKEQETKPQERYTEKKDKINLWEDIDIKPIKVDTTELHSVGKTFTFVAFGADDNTAIAEKISEISKVLLNKGFIFRYNGDNNKVYNKILDIDLSKVEMYIPWKKFNTDVNAKMSKPEAVAYHHAAEYHKGFKKLPNSVRAILARDVHVLLGESCKNPVRFLLCYSPDGAETIKTLKFATTGNISFSISICDLIGIPVFNLKNDDALSRLSEYLKTI